MAVLSTSYEVESGFDTTLKTSISSTQTAGIIINKVPTITSGVLIFDAETAKEEWISFGGRTDNGNNTATLTDVTRGLNLTGDTFTGSATRAFSHSGGVCKVALVDYHSLFNLKANKDRENTFTADQTIGTGKVIKFTDGTAAIRRDGNNLKFKDPTQSEVSLFQLANLSGVNDKTKISVVDTTEGYLNDKITAGDGLSKSITNPAGNEVLDLDIDLTDSNIFSATGVAGKVPLYDENGNLPGVNNKAKVSIADTTEGYLNDKLNARNGLSKTITNPGANESIDWDIDLTDSTIFSATGVAGKVPLYDMNGNLPAGNQLSTSGTANEAITDQDLLQYNGNGRLARADSDALNTTFLPAGVATAAAASAGDSVAYAPFGPIVDVPAFSLSARQNCRLWDGESNATSNTTTDTIGAITQWRTQSFIPQVGQDNVSKIVLNMTNSSLSGTGSVQIYASTGASPDNIPTGAALGTSANVTSWSTGDIEFDFTSPVAVTPGTTYEIVFRLTSYASGTIAWNYNNSSVYANGNSATSSNSGGSWTSQPTFDRRFKVQYRGIAGEPVYASNTTGAFSLTPGTYNQKVGVAVTTTSIQLTTPLAALYGTFSASVDFSASNTVNTDVTIGMRPRTGIVFATIGGAMVTDVATLSNMRLKAIGYWTEGNIIWNYIYGTYSPDSTQAAPRVNIATVLSFTAVDATFASDDTSFSLAVSQLNGNTLRFTRTITKQASAADPGAQTLTVYFFPTS